LEKYKELWRNKTMSDEEKKQKVQAIADIIQDLLHHVPYSEIIRKYNCSKSTISAIKNKRNWTYLTKDINFN